MSKLLANHRPFRIRAILILCRITVSCKKNNQYNSADDWDKIDKKTTQKVFSEIKNLIKNQTSVNQTRKETIRTQTYTLYFEEAVIINDKQPLFNEIDSIVNQINPESKKAAEFFEKI